MTRDELKIWLEEKLRNVEWTKGTSSYIKAEAKKENKYELILNTTDYLSMSSTLTERMYHIIYDLFETQQCQYCDKTINFKNFVYGYPNSCQDGKCRARYKKETIDEAGLSIYQKAIKKTAETKRNDVDPITGMDNFQRGAIKISNIRKNDIDENGEDGYQRSIKKCVVVRRNNVDDNGLDSYTRGRQKGIITGKNDIDENGLNLWQRAAKKAKETLSNDIDESGSNGIERSAVKISNTLKTKIDSESGLTIGKAAAIKAVKTRANDIDENGLNSYERGSIKCKETRLADIDENNLNSYERASIKTRESNLNNIDENGLNSYERGAIKARNTILNDIDENGLNGYERQARKAMETKIKNGTLFYRSSKISIDIIKGIIKYFGLYYNKNYQLYYGNNNDKGEWLERKLNDNIEIAFYDFVVRDIETRNPIFVMEYHGSHVHIDKEKYDLLIKEDRDEFDPWKHSLRASYEKDQIKKNHIINKYGCPFLEVFDYEWKENKQEILDKIEVALNGI